MYVSRYQLHIIIIIHQQHRRPQTHSHSHIMCIQFHILVNHE